MSALNCIIIVLILVLIWQCRCLMKDNYSVGPGEVERPYTPGRSTPAWSAMTPLNVFEQASTPARAGTLMQRLGMGNAAESVKEGYSGPQTSVGTGTNWARTMGSSGIYY